MKIFNKIICAVLAFGILLSMTSCADTTWVAQRGEDIVTAGMYKGMLVNTYRQATSKIEDYTISLADQEIEGLKFYDWISEQALREIKMYYGVKQKCQEFGIQMEQERIDSLAQSVKDNWSQLELFDKNGCDTESYTALNQYSHLSNMLFDVLYGLGGEKQVSDEEILEYYQNQYARVKLIILPEMTPDYAPLDERGMKVLEKRANSYLEKLQNGGNIDDMIRENNAYYNIVPQDPEQEQNPDDNYYMLSRQDTQVPKEFVDKFFETSEVGVPALYDIENYIIVAMRYDLDTSEETMASYKNALLWGIKGKEFEEDMVFIGEDCQINEKAIKKYKPNKIKI